MPVVMISTLTEKGADVTFEALEIGAVDFVAKPKIDVAVELKEYSKGMTRRIGLAQALINDPELILLDEPTSGLYPIGTREMKDMIIELKNQGKTVVICSHLLADVQDVCDRIAILYQGELTEQGRSRTTINATVTALQFFFKVTVGDAERITGRQSIHA